MDRYKLLLVSSESAIIDFFIYNFCMEGYQVFIEPDGDSGIRKALTELPHLVILDIKDGTETCKKIRSYQQFDKTIVVFLITYAEDYMQIAAFEAGADDCIVKPIKPKLLDVRIKNLLKRNRVTMAGLSAIDLADKSEDNAGIVIDTDSYAVINEGKRITLPRKELELLSLLMSKPEKVFGREEIYGKVWGGDALANGRTIDVHIRKLRQKIGENHIETLRGVGYKFVENL